MKEVYLDYAATSYRKPQAVIDAMSDYWQKNQMYSPGRGGYAGALEANRLLLRARSLIAQLFQVPNSEQVIFTSGITEALNVCIKGLVRKGDHVLTSSMEHNAVIRPLAHLQRDHLITYTAVRCDQQGRLDPDRLEAAIQPNTTMLVLTHAANLTGTLQPIAEAAEIARRHQLDFILDTAQTAGLYDLDFSALSPAALTFTGHKSLMGPQGSGGFVVSQEAAIRMNSLIQGGTGSRSHELYQPDFLPDRFEAGTFNMPGIVGLAAAAEWVLQQTPKALLRQETDLFAFFLDGLRRIPELQIYGPADAALQTPTVSVTLKQLDCAAFSYRLAEEFGIATRAGLHCAPLAHQTIATYPNGTVRFSLGHFTTKEELLYTLAAIEQISSRQS
ncbi:MAG: aminotransferase class V-fold PLP-dependent enzyme [Negativicutes bacterium]|nr:aminotransferase class V-fold PLP-dependent enzyme [Negativicutes bacterium]